MFGQEKISSGLGHTAIASDTRVIGDVSAESDMRIDGIVVGNVLCKSKVVVGALAHVRGDIDAHNIELAGKVEGNIKVNGTIMLNATSEFEGHLCGEQLIIEPNAVLRGRCSFSYKK